MAALVDWSNSKLDLGNVTIVRQSEQETTVTELQVTMFVDTCIFLHFKPFTQIKWREEAKADRVTLAVCLQVIDDLDKFTHDSRLGDRARRSLKEIEENENKEFQPGVSLVITAGLNRHDFPPEMDPDHTDNHVIRSAQIYFGQQPQATVMIVTEDTGMVLRARKAGVSVFRLPDSERLPNVDDELIRRLRKAEAELAEERSKRPDLELTVTAAGNVLDDQDKIEFFVPKNFQPVDVDGMMQKVRAEFPKIVSTSHSNPFDAAYRVGLFCTPGQMEEFNTSLDRFYERYERCLKDRNKWLQRRGTFFSFDLFLTNKGRALATSVQLEITFPPFIRLLDPDTFFDPTDSFPMLPQPPEKPSISDILGSTPLISPLTSILPRSGDERRGPRVILRNEDRPKVSVTLGELIHKNTPSKLPMITFWFPNNERPRTFGANYSALCAELPKSLEKHLLFEIARP
jgi:hypothetical protein